MKIGEDNWWGFFHFWKYRINFPKFWKYRKFSDWCEILRIVPKIPTWPEFEKAMFFSSNETMVWVCLSLSLCLSVSRFDVHMVLKKIFGYSDSRSIVWIGLILKTFWPILIVFWTNSIFDQFRRGDPYGINLSENEIFRCITFDNKTFLRSWRTRWPTGL